MHGQLGGEQQRQRDEQPDMGFDIIEEGHVAFPGQESPVDGSEHQKRQPGDRRQHHDAAIQQAKWRVKQPQTYEQLVERSTHHQREV